MVFNLLDKGGWQVSSMLEQLHREKIVAIVRMSSLEGLEKTVEALYNSGIHFIEITMNTPGALQGIERVKTLYPKMHVGAGTVLDSESARMAIYAGADFLLTPTLKKETILTANRYQVPIIPGVLTPTEALTATEYGTGMIKIFPARQVGPSYFSDLKGPLPHISTMAVGGIDLDNAAIFLKSGATTLGIGSSLVDEKLVRSNDFEEIAKRAKMFVEIVQSIN